jgi:hypothetical protein
MAGYGRIGAGFDVILAVARVSGDVGIILE